MSWKTLPFFVAIVVLGIFASLAASDVNDDLVAAAAALSSAVFSLQGLLTQGVVVPVTIPGNPISIPLYNSTLIVLPGNYSLAVGAVSAPVGLLCEQGGILEALACYVALSDCTYVHNKYGGSCGTANPIVPNTDQAVGEVLVCGEINPNGAGNPFVVDPINQCGALIDGGNWDLAIFYALSNVFRVRMAGDLCQNVGLLVDSVGCVQDCRNNHQYSNGACVQNPTPVATFSGETFVGGIITVFVISMTIKYPHFIHR